MIQSVKSESIKEVEKYPVVESELLMTNDGHEEVNVDFSMGGQTIPDLASISVLPATKSIVATKKFQLEAYGVDADGELVNITAMCQWTTASAAVVKVNQSGIIEGVAAGGPTNITATMRKSHATALTDTCAVTVTS